MKNVYVIKDFNDPLDVFGVIVSEENLAELIMQAIDGAKAWLEENDYDGYDTDIIYDRIEEALVGHKYDWAYDYNLYV